MTFSVRTPLATSDRLRSILVGSTSLLFLLAACGVEPPPPRYAVAFYAEADADEPLAGVEILANGQTVGTSDDTGLVQAILEGPEGTPFEISYHCPDGHRSPEAPQTLRLRAFTGLSPDASTSLSMSLSCPPNLRRAGFVVRTNQKPGLIVKLDGREVARTDVEGVAQFSTEVAPGTSFRVQIMTGEDSGLRPQSPTSTFVLGDADDYFIFDQTFEVEPSGRRRPRVRGSHRANRPPRPRRGPRRGPRQIRRVPMINHF
ncbi:MAG: hypothetical protein GXP55_00975 [Deltaproteobacteria bacterium]|nr:hypothetical protein [Deltaproteobacteria bacterium]